MNENCTTRQTNRSTLSYQVDVESDREAVVYAIVSTVTTCADQAGGVSEPRNSTHLLINSTSEYGLLDF